MKRRPEAKGILLALADRCDDDGRNAWPAVSTMAAEAEISVRTAHVVLEALVASGLIAEQEPPRQHKPRTWMLNPSALAALSDPQDVADLESTSDPQQAAALAPRDGPSDPQHAAALTPGPGPQIERSGPQSERSGPQIWSPGPQHVADEQSLEQSFERRERTTAALPRFVEQATEPNHDNYHVIEALARTLLKATAFESESDLIDATKTACAQRHIDYGRQVAPDVVGRACASAWFNHHHHHPTTLSSREEAPVLDQQTPPTTTPVDKPHLELLAARAIAHALVGTCPTKGELLSALSELCPLIAPDIVRAAATFVWTGYQLGHTPTSNTALTRGDARTRLALR